MKAPDKIYAGTITEGFGISKRWQVCRNYLENPVEYIRKDLLLEWAKHELDGWNKNLDMAIKNEVGEATKATCNGCGLILESIINKLNSL